MRSPLDLCSGPLDSITVEWECPTSTGGTDITRYTVVVVDLRNYTVEDGRSVDIAGLTQNINYTVFVVAENCAGESVFSNATYIFNSTGMGLVYYLHVFVIPNFRWFKNVRCEREQALAQPP